MAFRPLFKVSFRLAKCPQFSNKNTEKDIAGHHIEIQFQNRLAEIVVLVRSCTDARARLSRLLPTPIGKPPAAYLLRRRRRRQSPLFLSSEREAETGRTRERERDDRRKKDSLSRKSMQPLQPFRFPASSSTLIWNAHLLEEKKVKEERNVRVSLLEVKSKLEAFLNKFLDLQKVIQIQLQYNYNTIQ